MKRLLSSPILKYDRQTSPTATQCESPRRLYFYTYNICWGCQSLDASIGQRDESARPMSGGVCHEDHLCAVNVEKNIYEWLNDTVGAVSLQEVTEYFLSRVRESISRSGFKVLVSKHSHRIQLATLVNKKEFPDARIFMFGEYKSGRPWHLLEMSPGFGLLNVHRPHSSSPLSPPVNAAKLQKIKQAFRELIVVGDFNVQYSSMKDTSFFGIAMQPLTKEAPKTCCDPSGKSRHGRSGDLVLSSTQHAPLFIPRIINPASDHAPCAALITLLP